MKYLLVPLLLLTGCAHQSMLKTGHCYKIQLEDTVVPSLTRNLTQFKVLGFMEYNGPNYQIESLDEYGFAIYPKAYSCGYVKIEVLDALMVENGYPFSSDDPRAVKCESETSLNVTGRNR